MLAAAEQKQAQAALIFKILYQLIFKKKSCIRYLMMGSFKIRHP